ncbi:MAG: hypothetical protein CVU11_14195 [Bacteroidetes bacterium HGW-Bacteroidetes-6]|jgi:hypothetical protein|nr:MAG: hypothetical protein CVU11_14195 [Bacteroidetes bacterium HGW-Bacteroidetes-6]
MKKNSNLSKRIAAYSAMAVAGAASIGNANAQIVYTDPADVVLTAAGTTSFDLDLNADAVNDYVIGFVHFSTATNDQIILQALVSNNGAMISGAGWASWNWYGDALNLNDPIGSAGNWQLLSATSMQRVFFASTYAGAVYGNFGDNTDHYMGLMFDISGSYYYGWVRVQVAMDPANQASNIITIKDYAYNSTADAPILAGQMAIGVEENTLDGNIFAYDRQLNVELADANGTVTVYNAVGQVVISQEINNANTVIGMNSFDSGIYNVVVESNGMIMQKKVSL